MRNSLKRLGEISKGLLSFPASHHESSVNVHVNKVFFYNFMYLQILLIPLMLLWFSAIIKLNNTNNG